MPQGSEVIFFILVAFWVRPRNNNNSEVRTIAWRFTLANVVASFLHTIRPQLEAITGINQLGWVLEYLVGCLLFFYIYSALAPTRTKSVVKWWLIPSFILIILTFIPASKETLEILEVTSIYSYAFRFVAYLSWITILILISRVVQRWPESLLSSLRTRWRGINLTVNYIIVYLCVRLAWITLAYFGVVSRNVAVEQLLNRAEFVARLSWVALYIPAAWYVWIDYILRWPVNIIQLPKLNKASVYLQQQVRKQGSEPIQYHLFENTLSTYLLRIDMVIRHIVMNALGYWSQLEEKGSNTLDTLSLQELTIEQVRDALLQIEGKLPHVVDQPIYQRPARGNFAIQSVKNLRVNKPLRLEKFVRQIEQEIGYPIILHDIELTVSTGGLAVKTGQEGNYLGLAFYNNNLPKAFHIHAILHELGHHYLGHLQNSIKDDDLFAVKEAILAQRLLSSSVNIEWDEKQENEAEIFAVWASRYVIPDESMQDEELLQFLQEIGSK